MGETLMVCPECGGQVQATLPTYYSVDPLSGEVRPAFAADNIAWDSGVEQLWYCANDHALTVEMNGGSIVVEIQAADSTEQGGDEMADTDNAPDAMDIVKAAVEDAGPDGEVATTDLDPSVVYDSDDDEETEV